MLTTQVILASALLAAILIGIFSYVFYVQSSNASLEGSADLSLSLTLYLSKNQIVLPSLRFDVVTGMSASIHLEAKNHLSTPITIDKIALIGDSISQTQLDPVLMVPPYSFRVLDTKATWTSSTTSVSFKRVHPGDVLSYDGGMLRLQQSGTIAEYINNPPRTPAPQTYDSPFTGKTGYTLKVSGYRISADIDSPGYAANLLASNINALNILILSEFIPRYYFFDKYDIQFYIDIYNQPLHGGIYFEPDKSLSFIHGKPVWAGVGPGDDIYMALFHDGKTQYLYLNDDITPTSSDVANNILPGATIVFGVAREKALPGLGYPVSSDVPYLGVFMDKTVTVSGLKPGDTVILATSNAVKLVVAGQSTVVIDLLNMFGAKELISALKQGGVLLTVQPSSLGNLYNMMLSRMVLVHVKGENIDTWVQTPAQIVPTTALTANITSVGPQVTIERDGELYRVYISPSGVPTNRILLGVFPKVYIYNLRSYTIKIDYLDGASKIIVSNSTITINRVSFSLTDGVGMLLISDKVAFLTSQGSITDTNEFKTITITGQMDIEGRLGK